MQLTAWIPLVNANLVNGCMQVGCLLYKTTNHSFSKFKSKHFYTAVEFTIRGCLQKTSAVGGLFSADCRHLVDKGVRILQMRTSTLLGAKSFGFFEICDVSARTRGSNFCVRLLGTTP